MKKTLLAALLTCVLVSCSPNVTFTPQATVAQIPATETLSPLPTLTPNPVTIIDPTTIPSPAPIPVSTATEIYSLDNLRMAYIVDGNLYIQNGSNPPTQLTDNRQDIYPMFSDDGEKIVFYRGKIFDNNRIFSINADGSQMQEIITTAWLDTLGMGTKAGHLAFIPKTHHFLFNTYLCPDNDDIYSGCTVGLFFADADTGNLEEIVKPALGGRLPIGGDALWIRNFSISPDGKLISIAHEGQIDIFDINGKVIHHSIMKYLPGMPFELYPRVYWLSDSSGLIVALPAETEYVGPLFGGDPDYTIWRYTFDGNIATQILLDPPPTWIHMLESNDVLSASPNREWAIYFTEDYKLYKGNLLDGSTELLLPYGYFLPIEWSLDNLHFADRENPTGSILGSVNTTLGYPPGYFVGWIDAKRFVYFSGSAYTSKGAIPVLVGEINGENISSYETKVFVPNVAPYSYSFVFTVLERR